MPRPPRSGFARQTEIQKRPAIVPSVGCHRSTSLCATRIGVSMAVPQEFRTETPAPPEAKQSRCEVGALLGRELGSLPGDQPLDHPAHLHTGGVRSDVDQTLFAEFA